MAISRSPAGTARTRARPSARCRSPRSPTGTCRRKGALRAVASGTGGAGGVRGWSCSGLLDQFNLRIANELLEDRPFVKAKDDRAAQAQGGALAREHANVDMPAEGLVV